MECSLYCQICCKRFEALYHLNQHLTSKGHKQMLQDVFQKEFIHCTYRIPYIVFVAPRCKNFKFQKSAVGLSLITLCFSQKPDLSLYLCHVCKDTYTRDTVLCHTFSESHCFHYFVYTNPDYLSFSWKPGMDVATVLGWKCKRESSKSELPTLRLLHLPPSLLKKLMLSTYSEVMQTLCENDKLLERFEAMCQNRVTLQGYHSNHNRQHPLLGLQHIVECVSSEPEQKYYLCTLCQLVIPSHTIIGHLLSSDHVRLYFEAWHPSTLTSNELDRKSFLLDWAKQAEKMCAAENVSVQQVKLQPDVFKSVNFDSYSEALKSLESVTKRCLTVSIKPGNKIDHPVSAPSTKDVRCMVHCQNCCQSFSKMIKYLAHLTSKEHVLMMQEMSQDVTGHFYGRGKFYVNLYTFINECLKTNMPPVGTSLVMTFLASVSKDDPFYLCFACQDWFCQADIRNHFESRKHLISTQLYQNPWLLPFGWDGDLDDRTLRWTAWKEEQNGGRIFLKIFDVPHSVFQWLLTDTCYEQVYHSLQVQYRGFMHRVPQRKTYSKHKWKEQFPLLGQEFLALHYVAVAPNKEDVGCLCLLCERRLYKEEIEAHVFSREHVSTFLDCFHPGSLTSCAVDAETLLDLAKQAAKLHPLSCIQKISLDELLWDSCSYQEAKMFLTNAKQMTDNENLVPLINPMRKLVSRIPPKPTNKQQKTEDQKTCTITDTKEKGLNQEERGSAQEALSRETKEGSQKVCLKGLKNEGATVLPVKLSTEEAMTENPQEEVAESHRNTEENSSATTKPEGSSSTKPEATQQQTNKRKMPMTPDEAGGNGCKMSPKRQRLTSDESRFEELTKTSHESGTNVTNTNAADKEEDHKKAVCYSNERGAAPDASDKKPTSSTDQRKSSLSENSHASPVPKSSKEPADGRSGAGSSPRSANAQYKADVSPTKTKSLTFEAAIKSDKPRAVPSTAATSTLKSTAGPSTQTKTASTTSKTFTPQSQTASMASKSQAPSKEIRGAASSSDTGSAATLKPKRPLKSKDPAAPKSEEASSAASAMDKPQVVNVNTKPAVKTLTGGNPDSETAARKRKPPASHHRKQEEAKKVWKDLPHDTSSKTTPGGNFPKVGLNYLVVVSCERKQQVFCLLCSVRLDTSSHPRNLGHQYKYVKMKYPEWSGKENMENELSRIIHKLANVDKEFSHTQNVQRLEVKTDDYQTLRKLPDHSAIETVKSLLKQRDLKASSSRSVDDAEHPPKDISSPCDVSSSGIPVFQDEMSDSADDHQLWASLDQASEIEFVDEADEGAYAGQPLSETSLDEEDVQVVEEIQDEAMQTQDPQQVLDQCAQAEDTAETIRKSAERRRPAELQRHRSSIGEDLEAQNLIREHQQSMRDDKINPNPIPDDEAEDVAAPSVETTSKNQDDLPTSGRRRLKSDEAFQETQEAEKARVCRSGPEVVAGQQNQSGHKAEPAPALHLRPEERSSSQANSAALTGKNFLQSSDLEIFLTASNQDLNKVVGRAYVWECHSSYQKTFLCETCEKMLSSRDICQHMVSLDHQLKFLRREDQRFLEMFWLQDDLPLDFKNQILMKVIQELSKREKALNVKPECIWLTPTLHKFLLAAPFSKALELLKSIRDEDSSVFHPSGSAGHQRHNNADQHPGKAQPKGPNPAETFDAAGSGRTSGTYVISSSSKNDPAVLPDPNVAAQNLRPLEANPENPKVDSVVPSSSTVVDLNLKPCSSSLQPHYASSVSQIGGTPHPRELDAPYSRHNLVVPSGPLNLKPNACSGDPLQPGFDPGVSQLGRNSGRLDMSSNWVTELTPSSSINLDQLISSINVSRPDFWQNIAKLLSVYKTSNQPAVHTAERREGMTMSQSLVVPQENTLVPTADLGEPPGLHTSVPTDFSRIGKPKPSETGINQLPINTIITSRSSHIRQTFKGQTRADVSRWQQPPTPSHAETAASPGGVDPYIQPAYLPSGVHPGSAPTHSQLPLNFLSIYPQYVYPSQSYLQPVVNPMNTHSFSYSVTEQMPVVWTNADMQMHYSRRPESEQ